jgi:hypothetical protein
MLQARNPGWPAPAPWSPALGVLALALLLGACQGRAHMEGSLRYPPERPPQAAPLPEPQGRPRGLPPGSAAPPGIYFLHEQDYGVEGCLLLGERTTGGAAPRGPLEAEQARAHAVLDLAEQARWLGGNVVRLPSFSEDYRSGRLQGLVYRCDEALRRAIYERASAAQGLTVVPP